MEKSYKNLKIWQKGEQLSDMVYEDVSKWPNSRIANVISYQVLDSAGSVGSNIAEGYGRGTPGELQQACRIARGSTTETDNWMYKAYRYGLITKERYSQYISLIEEINKMISSFMSVLRKQIKNGLSKKKK